ncbi:MAG TPA: F0F1 ATP synthase subunit delta, partial [Salinimicrobium sp.]|nr:F0F1 ATP synthase subunit delta [Salinimicrobium sp.]
MKGNRAAIRYAKAVLELAKENNSTEEVNEDMNLIKNTISDSHDLQVFLKSPVVNSKIKKDSL